MDLGLLPPAEEAKPDWERNEALVADRTGEAVFKAIFGSEDDDERVIDSTYTCN